MMLRNKSGLYRASEKYILYLYHINTKCFKLLGTTLIYFLTSFTLTNTMVISITEVNNDFRKTVKLITPDVE